MKWYAAHIIMYVKLKEEKQEKYPVWENIVLIEASSADDAWKEADKIGRESEGDTEGTFTWEKKNATWIFAGIRKLIECEVSADQQIEYPSDNMPGNGTEISYSQLEVNNKEDLLRLVKGEPVTLLYEI